MGLVVMTVLTKLRPVMTVSMVWYAGPMGQVVGTVGMDRQN